MNNNNQVIIIQDLEVYDIKGVFIAPKDLDKNLIFEYIQELENNDYYGEQYEIIELIMDKFDLKEVPFCELYA